MLGLHCMPWATTALIHAETKSGYSGLYSEYKAANTETNFMLTLPNCSHKECQRCYYNKELNNYQVVAAAMRCKCDASLWPWQIEKQLGENNTSFQFFFVKTFEGACTRLQYSRLSHSCPQWDIQEVLLIAGCVVTVYQRFYDLVLRLKVCSY